MDSAGTSTVPIVSAHYAVRILLQVSLYTDLIGDVGQQAHGDVRVGQGGRRAVGSAEVGRVGEVERQNGRLDVVVDAELEWSEVLLVDLTAAVQRRRLTAAQQRLNTRAHTRARRAPRLN